MELINIGINNTNIFIEFIRNAKQTTQKLSKKKNKNKPVQMTTLLFRIWAMCTVTAQFMYLFLMGIIYNLTVLQ